ncbi:hypothetical protein GUJ93_ZPchr0009g109 [Zizania palustris]|uniref:BHLH domain-containing protein n=1 Tax=Zizania palustris TaxID=103762 RepID=A0A8J5R8N1_ZIZPA|nr:hypothetical protein GUJ93_ZPchr0009g109 [Zizania palustris]
MAGGGHRLELSLATMTARTEAAELRRPQRRTMAALYAELASLLPGLRYRACRADIVDAAMEHVKVLEDTAAVLEAYRAVQASGAGAGGGAARDREVSVSYREAVYFAARLPAARRPGALTRVLEVFDRRGVEVLAATLSRAGGAAVVTVTTATAAPDVVETIRADIARIE